MAASHLTDQTLNFKPYIHILNSGTVSRPGKLYGLILHRNAFSGQEGSFTQVLEGSANAGIWVIAAPAPAQKNHGANH